MRKYYPLIVILVVALDRASKWSIAAKIELNDSIPLVPALFGLAHVQHTGVAFGLFDDSRLRWEIDIAVLFSVLALIVLLTILMKKDYAIVPLGAGLPLMLGGAIGNLLDRLMNGNIIDCFDLHFNSGHCLYFNPADVAIVTGAILMASRILSANIFAVGTQGGNQ